MSGDSAAAVEANAAEVAEAIRLANAYPEQVIAVSVGKRNQKNERCFIGPPRFENGGVSGPQRGPDTWLVTAGSLLLLPL